MSKRKSKCCTAELEKEQANKNSLLIGLIAIGVIYFLIQNYNNMIFNQNYMLLDNTLQQNDNLINNIICNSNENVST